MNLGAAKSANTDGAIRDEKCGGSLKGGMVIPLPIARKTPKLEIIQGGKDNQSQKPETPFEITRRKNAEAVLRALREEGTTNTDFLRNHEGFRNMGTHTLRPIAFVNEPITPQQEVHTTDRVLHEDFMQTAEGRAVRKRELTELQEWLKDIPGNIKRGLEEAMKTIHRNTASNHSGFRPRIIESDSF